MALTGCVSASEQKGVGLTINKVAITLDGKVGFNLNSMNQPPTALILETVATALLLSIWLHHASRKTYQRIPSYIHSSFLGGVYSVTFLTFSLIHLPWKTNQNHLVIINISPSSIKRLFYRTLKTIPPINTHTQSTREAYTYIINAWINATKVETYSKH